MSLTINTLPRYKGLIDGEAELQDSAIVDNGSTVNIWRNTQINGTATLLGFDLAIGAYPGYVLTTDAYGNGIWKLLSGPVGPSGVPGISGVIGHTGVQGPAGTPGASGVRGLPHIGDRVRSR